MTQTSNRRQDAVILGLAALAMVGTLPGRTQGLGLITEPLLQDLGLDRVTYASLNFWATIVGAAGALGIGRALDRFGARVVLSAIALGLGVVVCGMSTVTSIGGLTIALTLTRALGQSALSVVSIAMVGRWFVRRVDAAMAVYSVVLSIGFMAAFPIVGHLVQRSGWRAAWWSIGIALMVVLAPAAALLGRERPSPAGDVEPNAREDRAVDAAGYDWRTAMSMPAFWVFAAGAALYGVVASGIGLFNESILAERGFDAGVYYQTLVVTAMTALAGNFLGGWLASYVPLARLLAVALSLLAGGVAVLPYLVSIAQVMSWAVTMGVGGGLVMVLFFSVWPRVFGRRHLGRIQGVAQAVTVLASAVGPLLLAWCVEATGSYAAMFTLLATVIACTAIAAFVTTDARQYEGVRTN
jgi:MFS family permease